MRLACAAGLLAVLLMTACGRAPSGSGETPAASSDPVAVRKQELNRVIPCCRALQERGAAFTRATQQCTLSFADLEAGRRTAADVFKQVAETVPAGELPAACK